VSQPSRAAHMRRSTPAMFDYTIDPLGCPATDCQPHLTPSTALLRLARPTTSVCDAAQNAGLRPEAIQYKNEMPNPAAGGRAVVAAGADAERAGKMRWTEISPPLHCHAPGCRGSQPYPAPAIAGPARVWTGDIVDAVAARLTTCLCVSRPMSRRLGSPPASAPIGARGLCHTCAYWRAVWGHPTFGGQAPPASSPTAADDWHRNILHRDMAGAKVPAVALQQEGLAAAGRRQADSICEDAPAPAVRCIRSHPGGQGHDRPGNIAAFHAEATCLLGNRADRSSEGGVRWCRCRGRQVVS
jgi:hypothetical protein